MLTFLRKIRRSLIDSGSTGKYLIYAVGEIALVIIGILIALQINNWNEERKDRRIENQALINLKTEFDKNQKMLEFMIETRKGQEQQYHNYLAIITNDTLSILDKIGFGMLNTFAAPWGGYLYGIE